MSRAGVWRLFFLLAGVFILVGGPRHPRGTMAEMLAHPDWVFSHACMTAAFVALLAGLLLYRRALELPERTRRWMRLAVLGTALQAIEMVLHTAAVVDHGNLLTGEATPILTTHLGLSVVAYPVFGLTFAGLIVAGARERALGSRWIAWLGVLGALAHGAAAPLTILFEIGWAPILFPMVMLLAIWLVLAAFWPLKTPARVAAVEPV